MLILQSPTEKTRLISESPSSDSIARWVDINTCDRYILMWGLHHVRLPLRSNLLLQETRRSSKYMRIVCKRCSLRQHNFPAQDPMAQTVDIMHLSIICVIRASVYFSSHILVYIRDVNVFISFWYSSVLKMDLEHISPGLMKSLN